MLTSLLSSLKLAPLLSLHACNCAYVVSAFFFKRNTYLLAARGWSRRQGGGRCRPLGGYDERMAKTLLLRQKKQGNFAKRSTTIIAEMGSEASRFRFQLRRFLGPTSRPASRSRYLQPRLRPYRNITCLPRTLVEDFLSMKTKLCKYWLR